YYAIYPLADRCNLLPDSDHGILRLFPGAQCRSGGTLLFGSGLYPYIAESVITHRAVMRPDGPLPDTCAPENIAHCPVKSGDLLLYFPHRGPCFGSSELRNVGRFPHPGGICDGDVSLFLLRDFVAAIL